MSTAKSKQERVLRAEVDGEGHARNRINMILRGPALGVPLWVPTRIRPCSRCLRLLNFRKFSTTENPRIEPVCDECAKKEGIMNGEHSG